MIEEAADRQLEPSRRHLERLRRRAEREGVPPDSTLAEAVEELGHVLEELSVTLEQLSESYAATADVTGLRRAEREAREAEGRTRAVLDAALDGILSADQTGTIRSVNPSLCRMFGYPAGQLVGRRTTELLAPSSRPRARLPFAAMAGTVRELEGVRRDGSRFPIQVSVGNACREEGRGVVVTIRDLTGQKSLESQLRAAAAAATVAEDRERRRLAADLHDDVSQLLTLAGMKLGMLRSAARERDLGGQVREVEELVARAHQRTDSLTFQLSPPILHDVGLAGAAEWLAEEMERSYGLTVHVERNGEPPLAEEMRITLFRSLRELLINVARHARSARAWVRIGAEDDRVRIVVEDRGVGFDPEIDRPGYGLLSIRERLRHLDGRMEIEAVPGDGTRVTLTAPLAVAGRGEDPGL